MKCPECGGDCSPECGVHPKGCHYAGFTHATAYWLVAEGCELDHGETAQDRPQRDKNDAD